MNDNLQSRLYLVFSMSSFHRTAINILPQLSSVCIDWAFPFAEAFTGINDKCIYRRAHAILIICHLHQLLTAY